MNKKIVVTGATKGIGRAIVEKFAAHGWDIAFTARTEADLQTLKAEIANPISKILAVKCDASVKSEVLAFGELVNKEFGTVDILVNNAGIFIPGEVINEDDGVLEKLIETNLYSAYYLSRALLPAMMKKKSGHIFTLCSVASIQAYPNGGSYSISKFGLLGLTKALREELKNYRIKVTALIAGATYTDSWKASGLPESRFMKAADVADNLWDIYHLSPTTVVEEILLRPIEGDI